MRRSGWSLIAAAFSLAMPFTAAPAVAADLLEEQFSAADANKDGSIDRNEYRRRMVEVFYLADRNKDGVLVIEELREREPGSAQAFASADKNHDGTVILQEFVEYRMQQFDEADTNRDGKLTIEEIRVWNASHPR